MNNKKGTKRALLTSLLMLLLSCSMFVGSTFAWFTDNVVSGNNIIKSGNLDIELEYWNGTDWTDVKGASDIIANTLWEPGVTEVAYLRVANAGSLALKYQLGINIINESAGTNQAGETFKLSDYIQFGVVEGVNGKTDAYSKDDAGRAAAIAAVTDSKKISAGYTKDSSMEPNDELYLALVVYMPTTVGNVANHNGENVPQIDLGINVYATQMTSEEDSFDDQYDKDAKYTVEVGNLEELAAALAKGGNIKLANDISTENGFLLENPEDIVLNLNGHTLTTTGERAKLFSIGGDADLTIYGGKLVAESTNGGTTGASTGASTSVYFWSSGNLTMTDVEIVGSVRGGHRAIDVYSGNAVLTNVDITTSYGTGVNAGSGNAAGTPAVVVLNDCDITVNGMYSAPYNSVCFSVMGAGDMTINGGNYKMINNSTYSTGNTHGGWVGIVMSTGGTLTINDGTYTNVPTEEFISNNERAIICADATIATVNLNGGTFDPQEDKVTEGKGTFNGELTNNGNGTWTASKKVVPDGTTLVSEGLYVDADGVYYITNAIGFDGMREKVAGEQAYEKDGTWVLYNDIDLNGVNWTPIAGFHGIFDGNKKTISNMNASFLAENEIGGGDFGVVCTIKDVTFSKATITGKEGVGVIVSNGVGVTIENVKVTEANVSGTKYVGGIVGVVNKAVSTITGCTVENSTIKAEGEGANGKVGGIVGFLSVGKATGNTVTGSTISGPECVGGIAGRGGSGDGPATIYGNTVSGNTVTGTDTATVGEQIGEKLNVKESE